MLKNFDAIIFDFDGTLVDSMWMWRQIDIDFLGERGLPLPDDLQKNIEGMSFYETAQEFKRLFNLKESINELMDIWNQMAYKKYQTKIKLKPGAFDFIKQAKEKGLKLGIASSNSMELITAATHSLGIHEYFDDILSANSVARGKPFPDVFLKVAENLNVTPDKCLVFEDITKGIEAGKNAGMTVCAVDDAYSLDTVDEKRKLADFYIYDYKEII